MTVNHAHKYATRLAAKYSVTLPQEILDRIATCKTVGEVAAQVLPQDLLNEWYDTEFKAHNELRRKFNLPPFTAEEQPRPVSERQTE